LDEEDEALEREAEEEEVEDLAEEADGPGFFPPESVFFRFPRLDLGLSEAARARSLGFGTLFKVLRHDAIEGGRLADRKREAKKKPASTYHLIQCRTVQQLCRDPFSAVQKR
jgi:hypothetical protein